MVRVENAAQTAGVDVAVHSEQKSKSQPTTTQQECKSYRPGMFRSSYRKYEHDMTFFFASRRITIVCFWHREQEECLEYNSKG